MGTPPPPPASGEKRVIINPSLDEASKFFDRPLSDAADILGVCPSVLKKICYDNGLVRWPYRKVLSGKTIEEIKKEAAIEKDKQLSKSNVSVDSSSISSQPNAGSSHESLQSRTITPQPSKTPQSNLTSTMNKENSATSDEFKYGFPSDGLSSVEYRWWGNECETQNSDDIEKNTIETKQQDDGEKNKVETKQQDDSEKNTVETKQETDGEKNNAETKQQDYSEKSNVERNQQDSEKSNVERNQQDSEKNNVETNQQDSEISAADVLPIDEEMKEHKSNEKDGEYSDWTSSLSCVRKNAAKEARNAKKLGVYRRYGAQTLNQSKRSVLVQIFKSSLPSEWGNDIVN